MRIVSINMQKAQKMQKTQEIQSRFYAKKTKRLIFRAWY